MGFANALSFKDVDEADIESVENHIKYDALKNLTDQLEESVAGEFESVSFCVQPDQLICIFGQIHASNPSGFRFERGDKIRIRNLVAYVKDVVDGGGKLKGLGHFEMKRKRKPTNSLMPLVQQKTRKLNIQIDERVRKSLGELKLELHRRIIEVLKSHNIDTNDFDSEMVEVEPNGVFGLVYCIACKRNSKKKLQPKRVFYKYKNESGYWVVSNFDGHIKRMHKSHLIESNANEGRPSQFESMCAIKSDDCKNDESSTILSNPKTEKSTEAPIGELSIRTDSNQNVIPTIIEMDSSCDSSDIVETIEIDSINDFSVLDQTNNNDDVLSYDKQISKQITKMMSAVIMNGDVQTQMEFQLKNDQTRQLSVVKMSPNGDCVFSAICHQKFRNRANGKQHMNETKRLRADVVEHILKPENFPKFRYTLQNYVYDIKTKSEIADMEAECKAYVRNVLSKSGKWGGMEVIRAASDIFECNILVFNENESCCVTRNSEQKYNDTLIIAYRYMLNSNGELRLIHYDSVTDLDPDSILAVANHLPD